MHFKGLPWDFLRKHPGLSAGGIWGLYCSDFYLQKLLLNRMGAGAFSVLWGEEVSFDWFRDNIVNSGLFPCGKNWLVYNPEHIEGMLKEAMLEHEDWEGRTMLLCFSKKDKFFDQISKASGAKSFHIELPRFWEGEKTLDFLCEQMRIPLTRHVKRYLLDSLSHKIPDLVQALKFLWLNLPEEGALSRKEAERLIESRELDPFRLADLLASKKFKEFYGTLVKKRIHFDLYRSVFAFMQTHLLKLGDPTYGEKKSRLSRYDRGILAHSKNWSKEEIRIQLRRMGEWEICAKRKDPFLVPRLRYSLVKFLQ